MLQCVQICVNMLQLAAFLEDNLALLGNLQSAGSLDILLKVGFTLWVWSHAYQSTMPHCSTIMHRYAAYILPAGYVWTCHKLLESFGHRAFGPTLWNKLPANIRVNGNHPQSKKHLKTFLCVFVLLWYCILMIDYLLSISYYCISNYNGVSIFFYLYKCSFSLYLFSIMIILKYQSISVIFMFVHIHKRDISTGFDAV